MKMRLSAYSGVLVLATGALVSGLGCSSPDEDEGRLGTAHVAISQVPADGSVSCIVVTATGSHTVVKSADVSPNQSTVLELKGLPVGTVSFTGDAYQAACASVTPALSPTWISDTVLASVSHQPVTVHLSMHRNGAADVDVDFVDEPSCRPAGAPCLDGAECCSSSCAAGACQAGPPACSPEGAACAQHEDCCAGSCSAGVCQVPTCWDASKNGTETDVDCGGPSCPACAGGQACIFASDCQGGVCDNGTCATALLANGQACSTSAQCMSGNCVDGVCCNTPCFGICQACSAAKTAGIDGLCSNILAGTDPEAECAGASTCDGAGSCL